MKTNPRRPNSLGELSVLYASVMSRAVLAEGQNPAPLFERFGLSNQTLSTPETRISIPRFMRLGEAAIRLTGNPALGLTMGELSRPVDAGFAGLAAQSAPTVGEALRTLIHFALLTSHNSRGAPWVADQNLTAHFYSIRPYNVFNYFVVDSVLAAWTQFLRTVSGQRDVLERVSIEYESLGLESEFESWFRCPVRFGSASNAIELRKDVRDMVPRQAQPGMFEVLAKQCERQLLRIRTHWTMGDRVKDMLAPLLQGDTPTLAVISNRLGIAPWTLQRQLNEEGTGFRELLDETRKELASEYIRETRTSIAEIAWLLGFANPAAFHKAWKRWYGTSPAEHRKRFRSEQRKKGIV
ncbi:AraC family transcriptional regulator [Marinobacter sp. CHS3-4]|uniref:AraC family transcriptional regulator n=1 Tax=Marinobacter sp. CHS3-4 TaxID=3045174 RepID=UPI0024B4B2E4|nr:AraC family transcriptional regulator [Marinobacter sp. CHS3-4]MDI9245041.1 AraC family transcriptional regulator [Marinobacter sp. CHS3-4]